MISGKLQVDTAIKPSVIKAAKDNDGLKTYKSISVHTEQHLSKGGFPVVPKLWAQVKTITSTEGAIVDANRLNPHELDIDSDLRFIADPEHWGVDSGILDPVHGGGGVLRSNFATRPRVREISYISGREIINRNSMRFSGGNFLYSDFPGYYFNEATISFVLALNTTPSSYPIFDYYNPGHPTTLPARNLRTSLSLTNKIDYIWNGTGGSVDPLVSIAKARPVFITVSYSYGVVTTCVSYSAKHHFATSKFTNSTDTPPMTFAIGGSYLGPQPSDFDMFEMNIWTEPLTIDQMNSLHAQYISVYGVHSDWS